MVDLVNDYFLRCLFSTVSLFCGITQIKKMHIFERQKHVCFSGPFYILNYIKSTEFKAVVKRLQMTFI